MRSNVLIINNYFAGYEKQVKNVIGTYYQRPYFLVEIETISFYQLHEMIYQFHKLRPFKI